LVNRVLTDWNRAEGRMLRKGSDCGGKIRAVAQQLRGGSGVGNFRDKGGWDG